MRFVSVVSFVRIDASTRREPIFSCMPADQGGVDLDIDMDRAAQRFRDRGFEVESLVASDRTGNPSNDAGCAAMTGGLFSEGARHGRHIPCPAVERGDADKAFRQFRKPQLRGQFGQHGRLLLRLEQRRPQRAVERLVARDGVGEGGQTGLDGIDLAGVERQIEHRRRIALRRFADGRVVRARQIMPRAPNPPRRTQGKNYLKTTYF